MQILPFAQLQLYLGDLIATGSVDYEHVAPRSGWLPLTWRPCWALAKHSERASCSGNYRRRHMGSSLR